MTIAPHLIRLYFKTSRRYRKLISRLRRESLSAWQRKTFLHELRKVVRKLRGLQSQLKIAAATGTLVLMLNAGEVQAQTAPGPTVGPFVRQDRLNNPLREPIFIGQKNGNKVEPAIAIIDFDKDGDFDVVVGQYDYFNGGFLRYFENIVFEETPVYVERFDAENPFTGIRASTTGAAPAFADIDGDADLDLFLGQNGGLSFYGNRGTNGIEYYLNDGGKFTVQTARWNPATKEGNPLGGVSLGNDVRPLFVDFDKDGDHDVIIGSYQWTGYPDYLTHYVHYFQNDGGGNFTSSPLTLSAPLYSYGTVSPAVADIDEDGDNDILVGSYNNDYLIYLRQTTPGNFDVVTGPWDPLTKTGNPFNGFQFGSNSSPVFVDFNKDGKLDVFVVDEMTENTYKYSDNIIDYYKNTGSNSFEKIDGPDNPFGGVFAHGHASPAFVDVDGDTELDAIIGNQYFRSYFENDVLIYKFSSLKYLKNIANKYLEETNEEHPLKQPEMDGYFAPQFVDVDGDADLDIISGGEYGQVVFFRNDNGEYVNEVELSPFAGINVFVDATAKLIDIDNDGDLDLFMTNGYGEIHYYEKDADGAFVEQFLQDNPLSYAQTLTSGTTHFLNFTDVDHDGDLDLFMRGNSQYQRQGGIHYLENTGSKELPIFQSSYEGLFKGIDTRAPQFAFVDQDKDGDLDAFVGNYDGTVSYLANENQAVITTASSSIITYQPSEDDPVVVDSDLAVADSDNDYIPKAEVAIVDFQGGEKLSFTPHDGISGVFDTETGVLTFTGISTVDYYQSLLRTVTFETTVDPGGRKKSVKTTTPRTITFAVFDIDFTNPVLASKTVNVFVNSPPDIEAEPITTPSGATQVIKLMEITTDVDGNLDPNQFTIIIQPLSGAKATIAVISSTEVQLILDYTGITFKGPDELTIRACDVAGACTESLLSVEVDMVSSITVYNAIAPNSTGDNKFMRITGLPEKNKVSIFNRWGDKVYEVENYQSQAGGNAFRGFNTDGKNLPSGTYFYKIEVPEKPMVTGYLTLKQ